MANDRKTRAYGFILYPENNEDLEQVIEEMHVPVVLSPLHDSDVWTTLDEARDPEHKAGTLKPAHWHGMFIFDGPVRPSQALACLSRFTNPTHYVEPLASQSAYARYMIHMDNPDKFQYRREDIGFYNGAFVSIDKVLTPEEEDQLIDEILDWIKTFNIVEYSDLVLYAKEVRPDWNRTVRKHTIFWRGFFDSSRFKSKSDK